MKAKRTRLVAAAFAAGLAALTMAAVGPQESSLQLFFTADLYAYLKPCG